MDAQGQVGGREVDDRLGAGRPVDVHPRAAPLTVGPCPATAVPMAVVLLMRKPDVMEAVIAIAAARGMAAGIGRGMATDLEIDLETGSMIAPPIAPQIAPKSASVIAPKSASEIAPVPSTEIRMPSGRSLRTIVRGPGVFGTGTIVMAIAIAPGMNGANRPSALDPVTTRAVLSVRMQHRRLLRPHPLRAI